MLPSLFLSLAPIETVLLYSTLGGAGGGGEGASFSLLQNGDYRGSDPKGKNWEIGSFLKCVLGFHRNELQF